MPPFRDYSKDDLLLLRVGRHLAPNSKYQIIIGRNEIENNSALTDAERKAFLIVIDTQIEETNKSFKL